jgi:hypothetical protein
MKPTEAPPWTILKVRSTSSEIKLMLDSLTSSMTKSVWEIGEELMGLIGDEI